MLNYTSDESSQSSHFIINTETENIILLSFNKLNEEDLFFNNDFLQDNILEMTIAKVATNNDCFCKELALTVKHIFDFILEKEISLRSHSSAIRDSLFQSLCLSAGSSRRQRCALLLYRCHAHRSALLE